MNDGREIGRLLREHPIEEIIKKWEELHYWKENHRCFFLQEGDFLFLGFEKIDHTINTAD